MDFMHDQLEDVTLFVWMLVDSGARNSEVLHRTWQELDIFAAASPSRYVRLGGLDGTVLLQPPMQLPGARAALALQLATFISPCSGAA